MPAFENISYEQKSAIGYLTINPPQGAQCAESGHAR